MLKYAVNLVGNAYDDETGYSVGFDVTVRNGGNLSQIGGSIQKAISDMGPKAGQPVPEDKKTGNKK